MLNQLWNNLKFTCLLTADKNQLMYGELRLDDIKQLPIHPIEIDGILINDQVRFFKGIITTIANRFFLLHFVFCVMVYLL